MLNKDDHDREEISQTKEPQIQSELENDAAYENLADAVQVTPISPYYSIGLIVCLVIVFMCQMITNSQHPDFPNGSWSTIVAGFVKQFFKVGEYWRILTASVLHGGIAHLGFNSYALYIFGKLIEQLSNKAHLAIIFVFSAICGGILSLIFIPDIPSVGASGGIVGFLGYLTVYGYKRREILPTGFLKNMLVNVGLLAFTGTVLMADVDNWAHLGGLIFGVVYGLLQIPSDLYKDPREVSSIAKTFGYISVGIILLTVIFTILLLLGIINIPFPVVPGFSD